MSPMPETEFTRVRVVANCHCLPLAEAFSLCGNRVTADFVDVNFASMAHMAPKVDDLYAPNDVGVVFSQTISEQFGRLSTGHLRQQLGSQLVTFTNVHFVGLHPDITYIGAMGRRLLGAFGDYHSKIVLYNFTKKRTLDECLSAFCGRTYEIMGYFGAFQSSSDTLLHRDAACDVRFAAEFIKMLKLEPCLYTMNHPTGAVFLELASLLAKHAGLDFIKHHPAMFQNHLSANFIWPIYDEIAEFNNIRYRSQPYFIKNNQKNARSMDRQQFVAASYAAYASAEFDDLTSMARKLPFYEEMERHFG